MSGRRKIKAKKAYKRRRPKNQKNIKKQIYLKQ